MSNIERKSEFELTEEEMQLFRFKKIDSDREETEEERKTRKKDFLKSMEYGLSKGKISMEEARDGLYYEIGMLDYEAYVGTYTDLNSVQDYLKKRAKLSAVLQTLESDMEAEGISTHEPLSVSEPSVIYKTLYHGTRNPNITEQELGKPGEDGKYRIRDGVSYFKNNPKEADNYRKIKIKNENGEEIKVIDDKSQRLERFVSDKDVIMMIQATNGGMCFRYQEDFIRMCEERS